jgi:hypothetical protein
MATEDAGEVYEERASIAESIDADLDCLRGPRHVVARRRAIPARDFRESPDGLPALVFLPNASCADYTDGLPSLEAL